MTESRDASDRTARSEHARGPELAMRAAPRDETAPVGLLVIRVAQETYGVRLSSVLGLHADLRIAALPTSVRELLGATSLRGAVVPVYSLAGLLGLEIARAPRWLLVTRGEPDEALGLAFDGFVSHVRVAAGEIAYTRESGRSRVDATARVGERHLPLIDVAAIVADIQRRVATGAPRSRSLEK